MKFSITFALLIATVSCAVPWVPLERAPDYMPAGAWLAKHSQLLAQTKAHAGQVKVVFLGASIMEFWHANGRHVWDEHYAPRGAYNYGIGGDQTQHVLWRIQQGEFEGVHPKLVVLHIGSNNIGHNTVADIAHGIRAVLDSLHAKMPNTKILLLSIFPRMPLHVDEQVHEINKLIVNFANNQTVHYFDINAHFGTAVGHEIADLYVADKVHLTPKGYQVFYESMESTFKTLIA